MAKSKPGKKFKYDLDAVLKVREIREKKEQEKFAEKSREYRKEKEQEGKIKRKKKGEEDGLRTVYGKGPIKDFAEVLRRHAHLGIVKEDLDKQVEKVIEASRRLEEQREHLISSMKDKKIIEKDKENKLEDYKKIMQKIEIAFLDEIATERFRHQK
ncbi:MAG: flagellar FliJ family protein [Candidatus Margulisiibacteriota bacterium]